MMKCAWVALGCASLAAACSAGAEDEGAAPVSQSASTNRSAASEVTERAAAPVQEAQRVSRLVRGTVSVPTTLPGSQDWKPELRANAIETVQDERGTFDPAAAMAMRDLRLWTGVEK